MDYRSDQTAPGARPKPADGTPALGSFGEARPRTHDEIRKQIRRHEERIRDTKRMINHYMTAGDWHGVEDAGSDIRDCLAAIAALRWVLGEP